MVEQCKGRSTPARQARTRLAGASRAAVLAAVAMFGAGGALMAMTSGASAWCSGPGCYGPPPAAGVVGGLAIGALAGAAAAGAFAAPPPPPPPVVYDEGPECYMTSRRVWVEGLGWRRRPVEVCD
ncbi:hypothetical protein ACERNI_05785 [Camelimonas sp. ID_303_24]